MLKQIPTWKGAHVLDQYVHQNESEYNQSQISQSRDGFRSTLLKIRSCRSDTVHSDITSVPERNVTKWCLSAVQLTKAWSELKPSDPGWGSSSYYARFDPLPTRVATIHLTIMFASQRTSILSGAGATLRREWSMIIALQNNCVKSEYR